MSALKIVINSIEDAKNGVPMIKTDIPKPFVEGTMTVGILEHGTVGGNTSIMFIIEHEDKVSIGQMTLAMLEATLQAARGADLRFRELAKKRAEG